MCLQLKQVFLIVWTFFISTFRSYFEKKFRKFPQILIPLFCFFKHSNLGKISRIITFYMKFYHKIAGMPLIQHKIILKMPFMCSNSVSKTKNVKKFGFEQKIRKKNYFQKSKIIKNLFFCFKSKNGYFYKKM